MSLVLLGLCCLCAALLLYKLLGSIVKCVRLLYETREVPGPASYPVVGTLPTFLAAWNDMHGTLLKLQRTYGNTVRMWILNRLVLIVMDPDDVQVVCTHPALANKSEHYDMLHAHLGLGLINMNGPAYKRHRKAITPSLHLDILQDFVPTFAKNAEELVRRLQVHADSGGVFDITPEFGMTANVTVTETVLSSHVSGTRNELYDMANVLKDTSDIIMWRGMRPWWGSDLVFTLSSRYKVFKQTANALNEMVKRILHDKMQDVSKGVPPPPRRRMAFLDHVLRSEESANISVGELNDELKTFLFTGSTTSMDFMSFVALAFTMYPEVQTKVQQELDDIFGADSTRPVAASDLGHMQYLERVLKETLRYAPPAPFFFREASEEVVLPSGHRVPRGCMVMLAPAGTHRDPRHFPDPLRFDPDRFLPETSRGRHPFAYIPFSAGPRNCVGQRYALMFTKTLTATLLRRYSFLPAPDGPRDFSEVKVVPGITMSVRGGARVRLQRRSPVGKAA